MSFPKLYKDTETDFNSNGIGILSDCISCNVTEERNGQYELAFRYPITGLHYSEIKFRSILKCRVNPSPEKTQLFRVYKISRPMNGIVTVLANHISYDLTGIPVQPFSAKGVVDAMAGLKSNAIIQNNFEFWTDKAAMSSFKVDTPKSIRGCIGGGSGSVLDVYGGELMWDNFTVRLYNQRGQNRGVSIRYGKNLTSLQQEENCSNVYTGIYPYWVDSETGSAFSLPEKIVKAAGTYNFQRIRSVDFSSDFESQPTESQLRNRANKFVKDNNIGVPQVSLKVSFAQLENALGYENQALLERVYLCDTVNVAFPLLGVSTTAKAVKTVFDVLLDRVDSVTLGSIPARITDTINNQKDQIEQIESPTRIQNAVSNATDWITNGKGYVTAVRGDNGEWREICIADSQDLAKAQNVWRWTGGGFGFSSHGYNGPYDTAITQDGRIVADFITSGILDAGLIKAGILSSKNNKFQLDLETGEITISGYASDADLEQLKKDGVEKLVTPKYRYSLTDDRGLVVSRPGEELESQIDNTGLYVRQGQSTRLQANAAGVDAWDLHAHNYLIAGDHIRWENYDDGKDHNRAGCFWI